MTGPCMWPCRVSLPPVSRPDKEPWVPKKDIDSELPNKPPPYLEVATGEQPEHTLTPSNFTVGQNSKAEDAIVAQSKSHPERRIKLR